MRKKNLKRFIITNWILITAFMWLNVFSANPSFEINPWSWTNLKLHCKYTFNTKLNASWQIYNWFYHAIKFNSWSTNIIHNSIDWFFSTTDQNISNWNIYKTQWAATTWSSIDRNLSTFTFYTTNNLINTSLNFTNCEWWVATFGLDTTSDCQVVNWYNLWWQDILMWLNDATYNFFPLPCIVDTDNPTISNLNISNWSTQIPSNQNISMLINDRHWNPLWNVSWPLPLQNNKRSHYRYSWLDKSNLNNYQPAPTTVDNQQWVDPNTIQIVVTSPSDPSYWTYFLSWSDISISDFQWNASINKFTRDSNIRWYNVSFNPPKPYPVEKQINISITAKDRANENWQTHTWAYYFSFNSPILPSASLVSPYITSFVNPKAKQIKIQLSDDRAWIDTSTVQFTIPEIYSWDQLLMTGYTYSWSELTFELSWWSTWLGNAGKYVVTFMSHRNFPSNSNITITWIFADLAANTWTANFSFSTRPDCEFFGCPMFLWIDINWIISQFNWDYLVITWTNPDWPYPYLTWVNNDIIMCGPNFTWTTINWNIILQDIYWQSALSTFYTGTKLYITWLDIILSWNTIFIQ